MFKGPFTLKFISILFMALGLISFNASALCMLDIDGESLGCILNENEQAVKYCEKEFGDEFIAYYPSNRCSAEKEALYSGRDFTPSESFDDVTATCLTAEQSGKNKCQTWEYLPADIYCSNHYGSDYLAHIVTDKCSVELADELHGFVNPKDLNKDLDSMISESEAIMTMIDRLGLKNSLAGFISTKPIIGTEFYTPVVKGLLSKLKVIAATLEQRSALNVKMEGQEVRMFLFYIKRYMQLNTRIHKIYAYVAHRNHLVLKTYDFSNFDFLNLKIKKVFGLELLSKTNYPVKNIEDGKIEFIQSQQSYQKYEYEAIAEPQTKVDYAKLISFQGLRVNITNLWAIDKIFDDGLLDESVNYCGQFLSLKSIKKGSAFSTFPTIQENLRYDLYNDEYQQVTLAKLRTESNKYSVLDVDSANLLMQKLLSENQFFKDLLQVEKVSEWNFIEEAKDIVNAESLDWEAFSKYHLGAVVLGEDDIFNKSEIARIITLKSYEKRKKTIADTIIRYNMRLLDSHKAILRREVNLYLDQIEKVKFITNLENKLLIALVDYNKPALYKKERLDKKINDALKSAKTGIKAAKFLVDFDRKEENIAPFLPANYEELVVLYEQKSSKTFQDIKLAINNDKNLAAALSGFFTKVAEKFNKEFLVITGFNSTELKGTEEERAKALYMALYGTAREYYIANKFEVTELAQIPDAVMLGNEKERRKMTNNPYMIKVTRGGTVVVLHINEFYQAFQREMNIEIPWRKIDMRITTNDLFGMSSVLSHGKRSTTDLYTDGTFGRPMSYISANGKITYKNLYPEIGYDSLERLYLLSMDFTKNEIKESAKIKAENAKKKEAAQEDMYDGLDGEFDGKKHLFGFDLFGLLSEDIKVWESKNEFEIQTTQRLFARVFELFNIPMGAIANDSGMGHFNFHKEDQKILALNAITKIYTKTPILRNEITSTEDFKVTTYKAASAGSSYWAGTSGKYVTEEFSEEKSRASYLKIAHLAYDSESGLLDEEKAKELILSTYIQAKDSVKNKLAQFCKGNYFNYKNDEDFKKAFRASKFIRQQFMSPMGTTPFVARKIKDLDHALTEETRTGYEKAADLLEPVLIVVGVLAIIAVGIVASIGTVGAATPAAIATTAGYLSLFITAEFWVSFGLVTAFGYARINTQFYDVPAQLKFQTSIAHSQIGFDKMADYDDIKAADEENTTTKYWTIGLMPLDLFYGATVIKQIRANMGYSAVSAYNKLSGIKLRKYSAPSKTMLDGTRGEQLRQKYGLINGTWRSTKAKLTYARSLLPKYQTIPEGLLKSKMLLRVGIARQFAKLGRGDNPSVIIGEVRAYTKKLKSRVENYKVYKSKMDKIFNDKSLVDGVRLTDRFSAREVMEFGASYSKYGYTLRSFFRSISEGRPWEFLKVRREMLSELSRMQGNLMANKVVKLEGLLKKLDNLKLKARNGNSNGVDDFLKMISDEEISLLQSISKDKFFIKEWFTGKQKGILRELRNTFKQYDIVVEHMRSTTYLYGHIGNQFVDQQIEAMNFLHNETRGQYAYRSESEDLVLFYESMIRQNAFKDKASMELRKSIEEKISHLFTVDSAGNRTYL